jgi:hypothetical protein
MSSSDEKKRITIILCNTSNFLITGQIYSSKTVELGLGLVGMVSLVRPNDHQRKTERRVARSWRRLKTDAQYDRLWIAWLQQWLTARSSWYHVSDSRWRIRISVCNSQEILVSYKLIKLALVLLKFKKTDDIPARFEDVWNEWSVELVWWIFYGILLLAGK